MIAITLDLVPHFFALFMPFCGNSLFAFFSGYTCLRLISAPMGFSPGLARRKKGPERHPTHENRMQTWRDHSN